MKSILLSRKTVRAFALSCVMFAGPALNCAAHAVWIEDVPGKGLVVRFGEFPQEYETSPGHLDAVHGVVAWKIGEDGKPEILSAPKKEDHFLLVDSKPENPVQLETSYEVMPSTNAPARKPYFYARWQPKGAGAGTPATILDIVPTGKTGEARLYFRGQPLPNTKLLMVDPKGDEKPLTTDAEGFVRYTATEPGLYLITCSRHRETISGFSGGVPYGAVSHNAALSWRQ